MGQASPQERASPTRRVWSPYVVLLASLALTALAASYVVSTTQAKDQLRFENAVRRTRDSIKNRLDTYIALLGAGGGLFTARPEATRKEFLAFFERLDLRHRYPGIQGIGFSARVRPEERAALVARMRAEEGLPDFQINPEGEREEYHSIIYLEPRDERNNVALGFDMFTEPVRRAAMERARDTGMPAASGRVTLVQEIDPQKQAGFLIYVPVYERTTPLETPSERQAALRGFVYSPFRADDLLEGIFGTEREPYLDFQVYDETTVGTENLLYRSDRALSSGSETDRARFTALTNLNVAGRTWTLVFSSRPELDHASGWSFVPYILLGGVLFSLALFTVTRSRARARREAERAVERLRASEMRFRTLVEQSPLSTQIFAPDGRTLRVNRAWEKLWGVTLERLGGYNILKDEQLVQKGIMPYIKRGFDGEVVEIPAILYDPQETIPDKSVNENPARWVQALIYPVKDEQGRVREVVLVHEDITVRKRLEEQLHARAEQLSEANRLKDEFLATLSHELRTPLTAILGWAKLLRTEKFDQAATARALETIERNATAQTQLIEDLLDVSRIITGKVRLAMRPLDLAQVVEAAALSARPAAAARGIELQIRLGVPAAIPGGISAVTVSGDPERLQQVVWNLLSNAIKFTPGGGRVEVRLGRSDGQAVITVADTGQGIAPEFLPHVFDRFRQADGAITREHGGLGLGLAIVRHLVELHGGQIHAASEGLGRGATFTVSLPLLVAPEDADAVQHRPQEEADNPQSRPYSALENSRVLVADDDADTRLLLGAMLGRYGARVTSVASAPEAFAAMRQSKFDVLVFDIGMPGEDGYELMRRVRALDAEHGGRTPAVALTAYARPDDRRRALDAGYQVHISKPLEPEEFAATLARLATGRADPR